MKYQCVTTILVTALFSTNAMAGTPKGNTTSYDLEFINNSGETLYIVSYQNPADTKSMMCPHFLASTQSKKLKWDLNSIYYPQAGNYQNVILSFYTTTENYSTDTPLSDQDKLCNYDVSPKNGSLSPPSSQLVICGVNTNGLSTTYKPGKLTITKGKDGKSLSCNINPYTHISEPFPYRTINVGQNYLPPTDGKYQGILPTRSSPILNISAYMNYYNGTKTLIANNLQTDMPGLITLAVPNTNQTTFNPNALLQIKGGQVFVQRNISTSPIKTPSSTITPVTFDSIKALCNGKCTEMTADRFVINPTITGNVTVGPDPTNTIEISQKLPIVISRELRAKNVVELTNPRALALIENKTIASPAPAFNPLASWIPKPATAPNYKAAMANALYPDGADSYTANAADLLAISVKAGDIASNNNQPLSIDLPPYFAPASLFAKANNIIYTLDASYLEPSSDALNRYGVLLSNQNISYKPGIRRITGVNEVGDAPAGIFSIKGDQLLINQIPTNETAVYQVSIKATKNSTPIQSASTTFYIYVSPNGTNYWEYKSGILPSLMF